MGLLGSADVHRLSSLADAKTDRIVPFDPLVAQVMEHDDLSGSARRVFWIVDNGSSHRGQRCVARLQAKYPPLEVVHGPCPRQLVE